MTFINTETGEYPVTEAMIRTRHPNISFAVVFQPIPPYEKVISVLPPEIDRTRLCLKEGSPLKTEQGYLQNWIVEELEESVRQQRAQEDLFQFERQATQWVHSRLENFVQTRGYDSLLSAISYVTSRNPTYKAEAEYCIDLRDQTWEKFFQFLKELRAGQRGLTFDLTELEKKLPPCRWPDDMT